jgi:hypothetical protein
MKEVARSRKIYLISIALIASQFYLILPRIYGGPIDVNGNALPDPSDGKSTVIDNSKGKEAPPIVRNGCTTPPDTEFRIGIPGWMPSLSGDFGVRGLVTDQDVKFSDIFKRLDMIAVGSLYARYHRWEIFADGQYMKLSDTANWTAFFLKARGCRSNLPSPKVFWVIG